jgi:YD repeat-containing protein
VLGDRRLGAVATTDSVVFDPRMLTSGGADQALLPTQINQSQIAYGVDSRLASLIATAELGHSAGLRQLAGITAAWYFGANNSHLPAYDPSTGRTVDGIEADGRVNRNAGAESTIHGLLSMLTLDANPDVAAIARTAGISERVGSTMVQAEDATLAGSAKAVQPSSTWTGESQFGGSGYVALGNKGSATFTVPEGSSRLVLPVVELQPGSTAVTTFRAGARVLGVVRSGDVGAQGVSAVPGALLPVTLQVTLPAGATSITATTEARRGDAAILDALMIEPLVSRYVLGGGGHGTAVLRSASLTTERASVDVPGQGTALLYAYDGTGRLVSQTSSTSSTVGVTVRAGGFTIVRR